ncbi:RnfABCDGE type electron transport complex subunit D [bacterium]|nr:RnfABCDGE type electron transport complex subunit D [bacterium]
MATKYLVTNAPYLRSADHSRSTHTIMRDLLIGLSPVILFSIFKNVILVLINGTYNSVFQAIYPLITLIVGPLTSYLLEMLCIFIMKRKEIAKFSDLLIEVKNGFAFFPGLFIVLISPVYVNMWVLLTSIAVGEVIGKMLFGGFGQNIFNPAIVGRAFMAFSFSNEIGVSVFDASLNSYLNSFEATTIDSIAGATPLIRYSTLTEITYDNVVTPFGNLLNFFLGTTPGALGETSVLACLIGCIYLSIRKVIDYKVPLIYVFVVFINTLIAGLIIGQGIWYPVFQIMSGGLMFGAVYMATEPVTSPKTNLGRIMNAMMLGVLTVLFRLVGNNPEGVATAIITMNIFGLIINRYVVRVRVDGKLDKNEIPGLVIFLSIFMLIFVYNIIKIV